MTITGAAGAQDPERRRRASRCTRRRSRCSASSEPRRRSRRGPGALGGRARRAARRSTTSLSATTTAGSRPAPAPRPRRVRPLEGGDPRTGDRRRLDDACRLADALPEVGLVAGPPLRVAGLTPTRRRSRAALPRPASTSQADDLRSAAEAEAAVRHGAACCAPQAEAARPLSDERRSRGLRGGPRLRAAPACPWRSCCRLCGVDPRRPRGRTRAAPRRPCSPACAAVQAGRSGRALHLPRRRRRSPACPPAGPRGASCSGSPRRSWPRTCACPLVAERPCSPASHEPDWQACTHERLRAR